MYCILAAITLGILVTCLKKLMKERKSRNSRDEFQENQDEMNEIRRLNRRILQEEGTPNAPNSFDTTLPSYEAALLMPKLERPIKSMLDLRASRIRTNSQKDADEPEVDLLLDRAQRFRSEEMLSNRDKERTANVGTFRRTGRIEHNNSGTRRFSIEDSRFPAANLKFQNLQSAEKIANFQSYENSPYTKRKVKIAEIPPFKRATFSAKSVEFLTDPEFEGEASKPSSPFARRKPNPTSSTVQKFKNHLSADETYLAPAVEDYFGCAEKPHGDSSDGSDFHVLLKPNYDSSAADFSATSPNLDLGKRRKRKNSSGRRVSGNFSNANVDSKSSSDSEPIVIVHRPMRETLF